MTIRSSAFRHPSWTSLPADSAALLWAIRHLVVCWPGCGSVRAALIERFGDDACGIEHLLRCLIAGIGIHGRRKLEVGTPCCRTLLADEAELLEAIGLDGAEPDPTALVRLCGGRNGEQLAPLAAHISVVARQRTI